MALNFSMGHSKDEAKKAPGLCPMEEPIHKLIFQRIYGENSIFTEPGKLGYYRLGKIRDYYSGAVYHSEELDPFLKEVQSIMDEFQDNGDVLKTLRDLARACSVAKQAGCNLYAFPD